MADSSTVADKASDDRSARTTVPSSNERSPGKRQRSGVRPPRYPGRSL